MKSVYDFDFSVRLSVCQRPDSRKHTRIAMKLFDAIDFYPSRIHIETEVSIMISLFTCIATVIRNKLFVTLRLMGKNRLK